MVVRFRTFAAVSVGLHLALFAGPLVARKQAEAPTASSDLAPPSGASAALGGDTFDVPELEESSAEAANEVVDELDGPPTQPAPAAGEASSPTKPSSAPAPAHHGRRATAAAPPPEPALYGAVGDRAAGDLVTTFKRMFQTAVSGDPLWDRVPVGFYADGDVTFTLDPDGTLARATTNATSAPAFREAVARTVALLKHRSFTAKGETTRTHMVVRVTDQLVNHGAFTVDARGWFELPSGKHVSVSVTER